jgi:hypothetical protein
VLAAAPQFCFDVMRLHVDVAAQTDPDEQNDLVLKSILRERFEVILGRSFHRFQSG